MIVTAYNHRDEIYYIYQSNAGQAAARNRGLCCAHGEYVAFLGDDDYWPPDKLEWQAAALDRYPAVHLAIGSILALWPAHLTYGDIRGR